MCNSIKKLMAYQQVPSIQKGMLSIGDTLPHFRKQAVVSSEKGPKIIELTHTYSTEQDKWLIFFWWPKDFTFICPTEIISFQKNMDEFSQRNTLVLGASTDSEYVHAAWCQNHPGLTNLSFPILADTSKSLATTQKTAFHVEANHKIRIFGSLYFD